MSAELENSNKDTLGAEWSHVRETVNMLYLAICQIDSTLKESNRAVETLTNSFTALANHTHSVSQQVQDLEQPSELDAFKTDLSKTAAELQSNISESVSAFQFYDRVCQRLDHVTESLGNVSDILESNEKMQSPEVWSDVQEKIKSSYTMESERIMFEFIMRGGSVKEALEIYLHHFDQEQQGKDQFDDEIELF